LALIYHETHSCGKNLRPSALGNAGGHHFFTRHIPAVPRYWSWELTHSSPIAGKISALREGLNLLTSPLVYTKDLTEEIYVTAPQFARRGRIGRQAQCSQTL
jgi:hypothetical protein